MTDSNTNPGNTLTQQMSTIFYDIQQSVASEVDAIRGQTDQIKSLLEDAIASLHEAFGSIHTATEAQMKTMTALMMQVVGAENEQNIFQQAESASAILTELVETLLQSSKNNLRALTAMDQVRQRLEAQDKLRQKKDATLAELLELCDQDAPDMTRIHALSTTLREQQQQQDAFASETVALFKKAHRLIDKVASHDMDEVFASKEKVEKIVEHFFAINNFVSERRATVSQDNAEIRQQLGAAIRALQFEDISRQSLSYTDRHLDRMEGMLAILTDGLKELDQTDLTAEAYLDRITALHAAMIAYHESLHLEDSNPVSQESMDEGDIDLF